MKKKQYYKVCYEANDGILYSAFVEGAAEVKYEIGEWAQAPKWLEGRGYYLTVFDSLGQARMFASLCAAPRIFECEIDGVVDELPPVLNVERLSWGEPMKESFLDWLPGTIMARRVKLLREV